MAPSKYRGRKPLAPGAEHNAARRAGRGTAGAGGGGGGGAAGWALGTGPAEPNRAEMTRRQAGIQTHYVDALGRRHQSSPRALRAIRQAMRGKGADGQARFDDVVVVTEGEGTGSAAGDLTLEDGTALVVDDRLPTDLPAGYHAITYRDGAMARLFVAPPACFLPESRRPGGGARLWARVLPPLRAFGFLLTLTRGCARSELHPWLPSAAPPGLKITPTVTSRSPSASS